MKITITRSEGWTRANTLATGKNSPKYIDAEVAPIELNEKARSILLEAGGGEYANRQNCLYYSQAFRIKPSPVPVDSFGASDFLIDRPERDITPEHINDAILDAFNVIEKKRLASVEAEKQKAAEKETEERKFAEQRLRKGHARQLLADELREIGKEINAANQEVAAIQEDRRALSEFIAVIDPEAKRAGLWRFVDKERSQTFLRLRETLECAASVSILHDLDDEEEEEKEPVVTYTLRRRLDGSYADDIIANSNEEAIRVACHLFGNTTVHACGWTQQKQKDGKLALRMLIWESDDSVRSVESAIAELLRFED